MAAPLPMTFRVKTPIFLLEHEEDSNVKHFLDCNVLVGLESFLYLGDIDEKGDGEGFL